jgi:hypothetical protein
MSKGLPKLKLTGKLGRVSQVFNVPLLLIVVL